MATYFPPQQLHGETDSVYDTIRGLGGVLYMPPGNANGVNQFVYPDDSTLAGTVGGTTTFDQSGKIDEILGGSPVATFDAAADKINFTTTVGEPLNMSGGGTWIALITYSSLVTVALIHRKSSSLIATRNGHSLFITNDAIGVSTSSNSSTASNMSSSAGAIVAGESFLMSFTLDAGENGKIYKNDSLVTSAASMQIPSNTATALAVGNTTGADAWPTNGPVEFVAMVPGVVLTQPQIAALAAQCGPLG